MSEESQTNKKGKNGIHGIPGGEWAGRKHPQNKTSEKGVKKAFGGHFPKFLRLRRDPSHSPPEGGGGLLDKKPALGPTTHLALVWFRGQTRTEDCSFSLKSGE